MGESDKIKIHAVGDIMLGDLPPNYGFGVGSLIEKHGPLFPFQCCAEKLRDADIVFGNLEVVLSAYDRNTPRIETTILRGQPKAVEGLVSAGVNIVSLANNHIMQHGRPALEETLGLLKQSGIQFVGIEIHEQDIVNKAIFRIANRSICFLAYNQRPQQYFLDKPVYAKSDFHKIEADIREVRKTADIVIISIHWGEEFVDRPSKEQVDLAHKIIDAGADIILGHHSHTIQGVETYKGKPIAYSLGNFVFDMWQKRLRKTIVLELIITKDVNISWKVLPVIINEYFQPVMVEGELARDLQIEFQSLIKRLDENRSDSEYKMMVRNELGKYRKDVLYRYLTSIFKYKPSFVYRNALGIIKRRLN